MLSRNLIAGLVLLLAGSTLACKSKMPTSEALSIAERICSCKTRACAGTFASDLTTIDEKYSGFAEPTGAKEAMKKAAKCAQELEPEIFQLYKTRKMGR